MEKFGKWVRTAAGREQMALLRAAQGGVTALVFASEGVFSARWIGDRLVLRLLRGTG